MQVISRIELLRSAMRKQGISACLIADADPHGSEYIADYWKERGWISGFDGSNGMVLLTLSDMCLWTDSRYELQAKEQLRDVDCRIFITREIVTDVVKWVNAYLIGEKCRLALNAHMFSAKSVGIIHNSLKTSCDLIYADLITPLWKGRPSLPTDKVFLLDVMYAGKTASEKLVEIRQMLQMAEAGVLLLTALDDVAWLLNIRGNDIPFNPLVTAYAAIDREDCFLFVDSRKITEEVKQQLEIQGVKLREYDFVISYLSAVPTDKKVWFDEEKISQALAEHIPVAAHYSRQTLPVALAKSKKNPVEIEGFKNACIKDGVALVRFFKWLEESLAIGEVLTEISIAKKLHEYRSEQALYFGESFATIAAYAAHAAIPHYHATEHSNAVLKQDNFLLLDSGGQYLDGTTDITRTVMIGEPTVQQKTDFTLVLKGHIALSKIHFPIGTCGCHLDVLARQYLWQNGLNYGHGTGHGVGHFLCVHEGPQGIRQDVNPVVLEAGMVLSNEPGVYREGEYGIRSENLVLVTKDAETVFGSFLRFEPLTLYPYDKKVIEFSLLNDEELIWLNEYHQTVFDELSPYLNEIERNWLRTKI